MAIQLAENLARTNPNKPIVSGSDVKGNAFPIDVLASTGSIPLEKREVGTVVFASGSGKYYGFTGDDVANWDTPANWSEFVLSGASGTNLTGIFSGSFSGSFEGDGSGLTGVISSDATKAQTVETISTTATEEHFLTFVDSDNGTAAAEIVYTTSGIKVTPETNAITAGIVSATSFTGSLSGTATNAVSASHVASAYDTVSVSNATISLTDMGGTTDQITVNNVVNSDTASAVMVASDNETDGNFYITTSPGANGQTVYAHQSFVFNPTSSRVSVNPNVSDLELHFEANSFTGSFKGDGSGLTGVAPAAGDGIFVTGTTVSVDSGSLIQTATNDSAYNVLFSNNTTPFAKDNTTSHFSYNPGTNELQVSGSIIIGPSAGVSGFSPELKMRVSGSAPSSRIVFEKLNGNVEYASIEIDNNFDIVNVLDPDGKRGGEQSFTWKSSGSAAAGLVTRMELTGDDGNLTVYGSISGSSLETSGQVTIGTVNAADLTERTALVIDTSGNVQSLPLGDAVTTHSGSLTVAKADGFYLTDNSSTDSEYNVIFSTDAPGNYIGAQGDSDSFTYNPGTNTLTVSTLVGDVTGTATTASYVETAQTASHVAAAFDTVSATNATITLTDMGGNNSSVTVNNVSNATTAVNATNATNATNISVDQASDDTNYNITFTESTTGYASLLVDNNGKLTYNPSTDVLGVGSTLSVGGAATVGTNLTVGGDLTVNGTTTTLNTTNLDVEDAFILLRSGSGTEGDSGIIFGGSTGAAQSGSALIWDASYNTNDGRLAVVNTLASNASGDLTPDYYVAGVFVGSEANAATAEADHPGNIRIDSDTNEIYIYA